MVNSEAVRTAVGIIGNVISFGLFMSPVPTFISIFKAKSVQNFRSDPYMATILNCGVWAFYGLPFVTKDNTLVITINGFGFFLEIFYALVFFIYSTWSKRRKIMLIFLGEIIFLALLVFLVMTFVHTPNRRKVIVGPICIFFNILMYFSPLTVMTRVIRTKSVKYMPFLLSFANFANGIVWTTYALLKWDPFIVIPNSLGTLSGLVQLILYVVYYRTTNWDEDDEPSSIV
ncbi:bidirectional sugar transporter SWEET5 [Vigna radiata var. radiata]|uniref:Bidirectional sugar transporter SWEET5 n=1 Tax=Vigna radiata var. radiata TaxID=3916 RepID=A0A1S3UKL6_VIGRR|nr:bidirectional sugar transporter SWEET5 [Vigna radiata var. radiata]